MYIVRETFIAKPGHAGALADLMKSEMASDPNFKGRIMLDMVTDYNKIVMEYEINSLADFDKIMSDYKKAQAKEKKTKKKKTGPDYKEMYLTGKREIYRIVE